ncbi:hypothetical protein HPB48_012892 [Haemaphysalis longicornis]|uniref:Cytochrome P450 n=1 Tax=Haemaphysalis longicornis TaxID=44386 RepID=A0A9J6GHM3_HAELO|nr:hypothetical protein HPB48_012892 [Haemaphysalis longicornis]
MKDSLCPDCVACLFPGLTEDEALAQCILFFLGGQDTTSSTLALCVYFLAVNPDTQEKLRREVDECIATHVSSKGLLWGRAGVTGAVGTAKSFL